MIKLKKASLEELDIINSLCEEAKKDYKLWDSEYPTYEDFLSCFEDVGVYILVDDSEIIGSISAEASDAGDNYVSLSKFFIVKKYKRHGYGRLLFKLIEEEFKNKYEYIDFYVDERHPFAFKMYESFGYTDLGRSSVSWESDHYYHRFIKRIEND